MDITRKRKPVRRSLPRTRMRFYLHFCCVGLYKIPTSLACLYTKEKLVKTDHPLVKVLQTFAGRVPSVFPLTLSFSHKAFYFSLLLALILPNYVVISKLKG